MSHRGPLPFTLTENFVSGTALADDCRAPALWFLFQGARLALLEVEGEMRLPNAFDPSEFGLEAIRRQHLGLLSDQNCFAAELPSDASLPEGWVSLGLREVFGRLADDRFALAGRALQIVEWDRNHQFCGACATPTRARELERARECPKCGLLSYPRIAPAVMVLVRRGNLILLARSPHFPAGMYSALAGFVDPGENLERTIAREVYEEVGLTVQNIQYFGSQPWPFPHSLMIAFTADYVAGEPKPDRVEIEDARWFGIDHLPRLPGKISISRRLIDAAIGQIGAGDGPDG